MSSAALLDRSHTGEESRSWTESATPLDPVQAATEAAAAAATKSGPAAHEITVHRAVKLSCERSFNASSSFVHFSHHGLHNIIDDRNYLETRGVRNLRQQIRWYESPKAVEVRKVLRSRCFAVIVFLALFVALFFPDLFVLLQVPSNEELDAILTTAFALFVVELVGLLASDPSYPLSFSFIMDLLGTFSMVFDISWALGPDASMPEHYSENKKGKFLVLRAAKAARLGARAGRLSRVVKILRFLNADDDETDQRIKIAKVISNKLSDVLSVRVAFLTICMAVVLPTVQMFEYPEMDESMIAWTQMITADVQEYEKAMAAAANSTESPLAQAARSMLSKELLRFGRFYGGCLYGPFKACLGHNVGKRFECEPQGLELVLDSQFNAPKRRASILELNQANVQVFYDMSTPHRMEAAMSIGLICFTILVMVVFSFVLSSNISVIALTPLERMLAVVRERCKQIFKFTKDLQEEREQEDEEITLRSNNEFALLEKAVSKLVAIAALSAKTPDVEESRRSEHRAVVLGWMQGGDEVKNSVPPKLTKTESPAKPIFNKSTARLGSFLSESDGSNLMTQVRSIPHDIVKSLYTPHFDSLVPSDGQKIQLAAYVVYTLHGCSHYVQATVPENILMTFVIHAESLYPANPFHNFAHALDVAHSLAFSFKLLDAGSFLTEAEQFWLTIAALGHDLGHIGLNNQFLVETGHELAVTYNDTSPLENMHCSKLFQIVSDPAANVFGTVERSEYKEMRKGIINAILHTDITKHSEMVKGLSLLYQMHSQVFAGGADGGAEVLSEHSQMLANVLLHCADIGNPMKPWELCRKFARLVLEEYFAQGDREKELGIPVQILNDREKVSVPNSQIGFSEFMLAPMVEAMVQLLPQLDFLALHLGRNIKKWAAEWLEEATPSVDAVEKVKMRVQKVVAKCEALIRSGSIDDGS